MLKTSTPREIQFSPDLPGQILGEIATILRAPLLKNEPGKGGQEYKMVSITDFPDHGFIGIPAKTIRIKQSLAKAEKYHLGPFDVLLTIVGTVGRIGLLPESFDGRWIPSSNMLVIRFKKQSQDNALAFAAFIRSEPGQKILRKLTHGTTIPIISKKEFSKIVIPKLTVNIKKKMKALYSKEKKLYDEIEKNKEAINTLRKNYLGEGF
jgi:type I restriction enzyme M protein